MGNKELLAIKVALEEWHHWLEGEEHSFLIWRDHKNLEYILAAKQHNARQARWALFFYRLEKILPSWLQKHKACFALTQPQGLPPISCPPPLWREL